METQGEYTQLCDHNNAEQVIANNDHVVANDEQVVHLGGYDVVITAPETYIAKSICNVPNLDLFVGMIIFFDNDAEWLTSKRAEPQIINVRGITKETIVSINVVLGSAGFELIPTDRQYSSRKKTRRHRKKRDFFDVNSVQ